MVRLALLVLAALALFVSLCAAGKQQQALRASTASTALVEATAEDAEGARIVFCTIMGSLAIARNAYNLHAMAEKEAMEKTIKRQFVGSMNKLMDWIDSPCPTPEAGTKKVAFEQRQLAESMIFALVNSFVNCEGTVGANEKPYDKSKYAGDFKDFMTNKFKAAKKKYLPKPAKPEKQNLDAYKPGGNRGCGLSELEHDHVTDADSNPAVKAANKVFDLTKVTVDKLLADGVGDGVQLVATACTAAIQYAADADSEQTTLAENSGVNAAAQSASSSSNLAVAGEVVSTGLSVVFACVDPTGISAVAAASGVATGSCKIGQAQKEKTTWKCTYCPVLQDWCKANNKRREAKGKLPFYCGAEVDTKEHPECAASLKIKPEKCPKELSESCNYVGSCNDPNAKCKPDPEDQKNWEKWHTKWVANGPGMRVGEPPINHRCECVGDDVCASNDYSHCLPKDPKTGMAIPEPPPKCMADTHHTVPCGKWKSSWTCWNMCTWNEEHQCCEAAADVEARNKKAATTKNKGGGGGGSILAPKAQVMDRS